MTDPLAPGAATRRRSPWPAVVLALLLIGMLSAVAGGDRAVPEGAIAPVSSPGDERPNIVLFSSDDQRLDEMVFLPKVRALLGEHGLTMSEAITPHPLCCPARAEILTGQMAQNNGVRTNFPPQGGYAALDPDSTIGTDLTAAGYNTAFLGKPLNGYDEGDGRDPGWTIFNATSHGYSDYYDFTQFDEDRKVRVDGYYTDYLAQKSVEYARDLSDMDAPFFLWVSHFAPHPSKGRSGCHDASCKNAPPRLSPTHEARSRLLGRLPMQDEADRLAATILDSPGYREVDRSDKPRLVRRQSGTSDAKVRRLVRARAGALASLDDAFARLAAQLRADGELDNTYVVFVTDNGYTLGEHGWFGKTLPYEQNLRMPMLVAGPGVEAGSTSDVAVSIVDLAATFLDIAGAGSERRLDGVSLLPTWTGRSTRALHPGGMLIQGGPFKPETGPRGWLYRGVRTERYTYARHDDGTVELYDRLRDPHEVDSVAGRPAYAAVQRELARRTAVLGRCSGPRACNRDFGPLPSAG